MRISPSLARDGMRWSSLVVMTNRSDRGLVKPKEAQRFERDDVIREPACGLHQGQQP